MWERIVVGVALLAHGFVHFRAWWMPMPGSSNLRRSWLIGEATGVSVGLATVAAIAFAAAGGGLIADQGWWPQVALAATGLSMVLIVLVFNRWLLLATALNALVAWYALRALD